MATKPESDIKIMLPRSWERALYLAQAEEREGSLAAVSRKIIEDYLRAKGFLPSEETPAGSEASTEAAATA